MTKMIKLSLAAAVAVAGFTTTASAGDLTEMIKGVKVNGYVRYQNTNLHKDSGAAGTNTDAYKIVINSKIPVNDNVVAGVKLVNTGDAFGVNQAKFTYTQSGVAVTAGLQAYGLPVTNDATGTGAKAVINAGPATVIVAGFSANNTTAASSTNAKAAALVVPAGPVTLTGMIAEAQNAADNTKVDDFSYANAKVKVGPVAINATSVRRDNDGAGDDSGADWMTVSGSVAGFGLTAGFCSTEKNNGGKNSTSNQNYNIADGGAADRTAADFALIQANAADLADADITLLKITKKIGPVNVMVAMADADLAAANKDVTETAVKVTYKMSKNFSTYVWVSELDYDDVAGTNNDNQKTRLEVKYSF
jgi:hypothetical protein